MYLILASLIKFILLNQHLSQDGGGLTALLLGNVRSHISKVDITRLTRE